MKVLCLLALATVMIGTSTAQERSASVESKIIAIEKAWNQAYKLRDKKALNEILDDSIIIVNDDGSLMSKGTFLGLVDQAKGSDEQQVAPESMSVHVFGNVAIATGVFQSKGVEGGKSFTRRNRFADTWMNKNGSWVCVSASATPVSR